MLSVGPSIVLDANVAAVITALALLITSLSGLVVAIRTRKENAVAIEEVHTIVNSYASAQALRIEQLGQALNAAGMEVPPALVQPPPLVRSTTTTRSSRPAVVPEPMELTGTVTGTVEPTKKSE